MDVRELTQVFHGRRRRQFAFVIVQNQKLDILHDAFLIIFHVKEKMASSKGLERHSREGGSPDSTQKTGSLFSQG
jgi:hypothetical protein